MNRPATVTHSHDRVLVVTGAATGTFANVRRIHIYRAARAPSHATFSPNRERMFRGFFGRFGNRRAGSATAARRISQPQAVTTPRPERPSSELSAASIFASAQKDPVQALIVTIPAHHAVSVEHVLAHVPPGPADMRDIIVACAGQPADRAAIHAGLRSADFLLAPAETSREALRALAAKRAAGDILTFIDGHAADAAPGHRTGPPMISIIVPVSNAAPLLAETLRAVTESTIPRQAIEIIVVDDASSDETVATAAEHADTLVRLRGGTRGAAYARNRGAELANGEILLFLDTGVRVARGTLAQILQAFEANPSEVAVSACNDGSSGDGGIPTQYWNLLQQYAAQTGGASPIHFNASCGAVRRAHFFDVGAFDEWRFRDTSVEDLELGARLGRAGHGVSLRPDVPFASVRPHGLRGVLLRSWRRSALLTRILGYKSTKPLAGTHFVYALGHARGVAAAACAALIVSAGLQPTMLRLSIAGASLAALVTMNWGLLSFLARRRGLTFAIAAAPLHWAAQIAVAGGAAAGWALRHTIGEPAPDATTQAFAEVGVKMWPPVPRRQ